MTMTIPPVMRPSEEASEINPLIAGRWSSRAIDPALPVDDQAMERIFEAARWAPSAMNNQPWRILSLGPGDPDALERGRKTLTRGNAWALAAPRLLFVLSRTDSLGGGAENPRAKYEAGMAAVLMAIQAEDEGLVFHQMAGFDAEALRREFSVPGNFTPITAVAIGRPGPVDGVPEAKRDAETAPRTRKSLDEIVFPDGSVPSE